MKVHIRYPNGASGWGVDIDMPAVPRHGDDLMLYDADGDEEHHQIQKVIWTPQHEMWDAYVVLEVAR